MGCFPDFADEISDGHWRDLPITNAVIAKKRGIFGKNQRSTPISRQKKRALLSTAISSSLQDASLEC
jgi:hypothetical protein